MRYLLLLLLATNALPATPPGQLASPVSWVEDGNAYYMGQKESGGLLVLGPDQSYFTGRLHCFGNGPDNLPARDLNQNKSFAGIGGWTSAQQEIRWHLWIQQPGKLSISPYLAVDHAGSTITLSLDGATSGHVISASDGSSAQPWKAAFDIRKAGFHTLTLRGSPRDKEIARIHRLEASGPAIHGSSLLRSRWRPAAVHAGRFKSSSMHDTPAEVIVMQVRPKLTTHSVYAPVTTPFGYYGSKFLPGGTIGGLNFSMWSFGRDQKAPALAKQSRLLAIGSPKAKFSGFSHEGTGVKVRGWNPWEGKHTDVQTLALRVEHSETTTTYYGYFLDPGTNTWKLYAVGRKPHKNKRSPNRFGVGAFVEVPGRAATQRSGDIPREVHFRGWACGKDGKWHPFDSIAGPGRASGKFNKTWDQTQDGWFTMKIGGMAHYAYHRDGGIHIEHTNKNLPQFLRGESVNKLYKLPSTVTLAPTQSIKNNAADIQFSIDSHIPGNAIIHWGKIDALTFSKHWQHSASIPEVKPGHHTYTLDKLTPNTTYHYRILLQNKEGQFWSFRSGSFKTTS